MDEECNEVTRVEVKIADLGRLMVGDWVKLSDGKRTGSIVKIHNERRVPPFPYSEYKCEVQCTNGEVVVEWLSRPKNLIK